MAPESVLVTGVGLTGGEVLRKLAEARVPARALARNRSRAEPFKKLGIEIIEGDFAQPDAWARALDGIDRVFVVTPVHPDAEIWFDKFLSVAQTHGLRQVVKLSGKNVDPSSPAEIHRQMGRSDEALRASGLPYTILRPNVFYQNIFAAADMIRAQGRFHLAVGSARISMIDVRDISAVAIKALLQDGHEAKVYDLTGPEALSYHDVARALSDALGKRIEYVPVSAEMAERAMVEHGVPPWIARGRVELHRHFSIGKFSEVTRDVETLIGGPPRTFSEFARDYADRFR